MDNTTTTGKSGAASPRALYAHIAAAAGEADRVRAERLLLRGIERRWPGARTRQLLQSLALRALPQAPAEVTS